MSASRWRRVSPQGASQHSMRTLYTAPEPVVSRTATRASAGDQPAPESRSIAALAVDAERAEQRWLRLAVAQTDPDPFARDRQAAEYAAAVADLMSARDAISRAKS